MTQDIIEMGVQAGIQREILMLGGNLELLINFAKLVAADAVAKEREACAKICEPQSTHDDPLTAWKIAAAIRARGNT